MPSQFTGHARPAGSAKPPVKIRLAPDASRAGMRTLFALFARVRRLAIVRMLNRVAVLLIEKCLPSWQDADAFQRLAQARSFRAVFVLLADLSAKMDRNESVSRINRITLRDAESVSLSRGRRAVIKSSLLRHLLPFTTYRTPIALSLGRVPAPF